MNNIIDKIHKIIMKKAFVYLFVIFTSTQFLLGQEKKGIPILFELDTEIINQINNLKEITDVNVSFDTTGIYKFIKLCKHNGLQKFELYFSKYGNSKNYEFGKLKISNETGETEFVINQDYNDKLDIKYLTILDSIGPNVKFSTKDNVKWHYLMPIDSFNQCYVKEYHNDKIDSQGWALYLKGDDFFVESIKVGKWIYYNDDGIIKEIIDYSKE